MNFVKPLFLPRKSSKQRPWFSTPGLLGDQLFVGCSRLARPEVPTSQGKKLQDNLKYEETDLGRNLIGFMGLV